MNIETVTTIATGIQGRVEQLDKCDMDDTARDILNKVFVDAGQIYDECTEGKFTMAEHAAFEKIRKALELLDDMDAEGYCTMMDYIKRKLTWLENGGGNGSTANT